MLRPTSLVMNDIVRLVEELPDGLELVVAIGGGLAMDAGKQISVRLDLDLVMVPAVVSTGAAVNSWFAQFEEMGILASETRGDWPFSDPEVIIVDPELILMAPDHLSTAGLGDSFCKYAGFAEWKHRSDRGTWTGLPYDGDAAEAEFTKVDRIVEEFVDSLHDGRLTVDSIRLIFQTLQVRGILQVTEWDPDGEGTNELPLGDHALDFYMELAHRRTWVHGEVVALGAVIVTWHADQPTDRLVGWYDACRVRWRPEDQGITKQELAKALEYGPDLLPVGGPMNVDTILLTNRVVGQRFEELWTFLTT